MKSRINIVKTMEVSFLKKAISRLNFPNCCHCYTKKESSEQKNFSLRNRVRTRTFIPSREWFSTVERSARRVMGTQLFFF